MDKDVVNKSRKSNSRRTFISIRRKHLAKQFQFHGINLDRSCELSCEFSLNSSVSAWNWEVKRTIVNRLRWKNDGEGDLPP